MNNEEKDIEFIERYLEEKLSPEELADFQNRISADKKFEKDFNTYKALIGGIKYSAKNSSLQKLKKLEASISVQESFDKKLLGIPSKYRYHYSIAATILLLLAITLIFILQHKPSPEDLYAQNFKPYPNVVTPTNRGSDTSEESDHQEAFYLYDSEQYENAIPLLEELYGKEHDPALLLYLSNSYMATGRFEESIKSLKELTKTDSKFKNQAYWYLALSHLAKNQILEAKEVLQKVKAEKNSYSQKAEELLEAIE